MKTNNARFQKITADFPKLVTLLEQMNNADISYAIGGSVALYVQGIHRTPKDVDIMFTDEAFDRVNKLFSLQPERIERPYSSMYKSTPVDDDSIDFLNRYAAKIEGRIYYTPPIETVSISHNGIEVMFVPAEKIAAFKLISRREHHNDLKDFEDLFHHPDFDKHLFWQIVDSLGARDDTVRLLGDF